MISLTDHQRIKTAAIKDNNTITAAQNHLGVMDLNNLPDLNEKSLIQLLADTGQLDEYKQNLTTLGITDLNNWFERVQN